MDNFLAEYYGTAAQDEGAYADDDLEKMAQLTLLTKEAAAEGVDLSQFSDQELLAMADELYGGETAGAPDMEKEAQAKFEEADFLGRIMAHSFNQELGDIEKQAGWAQEGAKRLEGAAGRAASGVRRGAEWLGGKTIGKGRRGAISRDIAGGEWAQRGGERMSAKGRREFEKAVREQAGERVGTMARRRGYGMMGAGGALAAGAGGAGIYAATRDKKKKSSDSAFEQLVLDRANEHLEAAGLLQKEAGGDDFDTAVDRAALELLEANGYPVEWY